MATPSPKKPVRPAAPVDPDDELVGSMRQGGAPWVRGVILNALLAVALLGGPWVRGMFRAEASIAAFGRLSACMTGGTVDPAGGLVLPEGDRAAFAAMLRSGDATWPGRCLPELEAVRSDDALLILPGVKEKEADVRAAATLLRGELERVTVSPDGDVPASVLAALGQLQGTLTELAAAASARIDVRANAIVLPEDGTEVASRLPLTVPVGGTTDVRFTAEGIDVVAAEARRVAVLRVRGGTVHEEHERRSNGAHGLHVGADATAHLLFTTRDDVCDGAEDHCAHRMTGLAVTDGTAVTEREPELWLAGHLWGRADRGVSITGAQGYLLATTEDGGLEVRGFDWSAADVEVVPADEVVPEEEATEDEADRPRHRARETIALGRVVDALLTASDVAWVERGGVEGTVLRRAATFPVSDAAAPSTVALAIEPRRLWACGDYAVVASADALEVIAGDRSIGTVTVQPRAPLTASSETDEPVQLACSDDLLIVGVVRRGPTARIVACDRDACRTLLEGSDAVHGLDVAVGAGFAWVATWGAAGAHQVVVRRARVGPLGGMALESAPTLPPCWSDGRGFCAPASFASDGEHVALFTREGTDALLMALEDGELRGLPGLR